MKFDPELFDSSYWFQNAERLKISANVLKDKLYEQESEAEIIAVGTQNYHNQKLAFLQSYMMLIGFSLENLIKGFSIFRYKKKHPTSSITDFKFLMNKVWKVNSGHKLIEIAENSGLELAKSDKELLERYQKFLVWAGRYHIPLKPNEYEDAFGNNRLKYSSLDDDLLREFFFRLKHLINKENMADNKS